MTVGPRDDFVEPALMFCGELVMAGCHLARSEPVEDLGSRRDRVFGDNRFVVGEDPTVLFDPREPDEKRPVSLLGNHDHEISLSDMLQGVGEGEFDVLCRLVPPDDHDELILGGEEDGPQRHLSVGSMGGDQAMGKSSFGQSWGREACEVVSSSVDTAFDSSRGVGITETPLHPFRRMIRFAHAHASKVVECRDRGSA